MRPTKSQATNVPPACTQRDGQELTPWPCPYCGQVHDAATEVTGAQQRPGPGDLTLCLSCGRIGYYDELMLVCKMTQEMWASLEPEVKAEVMMAASVLPKWKKKYGTEETGK